MFDPGLGKNFASRRSLQLGENTVQVNHFDGLLLCIWTNPVLVIHRRCKFGCFICRGKLTIYHRILIDHSY
jgi:hypothetical protein